MPDTINDYITGRPVPDTGAEANRQAIERLLVETKGFEKNDIRVDEPIKVRFKGEDYCSTLDLIVFFKQRPVMAFKCVAGAIHSYEREILAGARLVYDIQIPYAVSCDGMDAVILDTLTGRKIGQGLDAVFNKKSIEESFSSLSFTRFPDTKKEREMIVFRSFNMDKINR